MPFLDEQGRTRIGRQKGTPNKRTKELREKMAKQSVPDPVITLCRQAVDPRLSPDQRRKAARDAAPFIWPKRGTYAPGQQPVDALTEDRLIDKLTAKQSRDAKSVGTTWRPDNTIPNAPSIGGTVLSEFDPFEDE